MTKLGSVMTSVLVTGGAGYIGSHVCKALFQRGIDPVTLDNLTRGHELLAKFGPLEVGDISDVDWVRKLIQRYNPAAVIHCAAYTSVTESLVNPATYYCNNVIGTLSLLNAMVAEGLRKLVFSSSAAVYGQPEHMPIREEDPCRPITPYGRSKWIMEQVISDYADAYGMRCVSLRYFNAAGADPHGEIGELHDPETHAVPLAIMAALEGRAFKIFGTDYPTADGTCLRDYVHVTDLADAHLAALAYLEDGGPSAAFNVGTGNGTSVKELVDTVSLVAGKKLAVEEAPRRPGDPAELVADASRVRSALQFNPSLSTIDAIVETAWKWHKSVKKA